MLQVGRRQLEVLSLKFQVGSRKFQGARFEALEARN